jgi:hypothetical protein
MEGGVMDNGRNTMAKGVGLALLAGGAGLIYWGYQLSGSLTAELTRTLSGALPDDIMYRYLGGGVSCILGMFLLTRR